MNNVPRWVLQIHSKTAHRHGLAASGDYRLKSNHADEAASEHFQAMLELNPDDNQGVRYMLLLMFMDDNATEETEELLRRYKDDASAVWMYSHALFLYRQEGKGRKANAQVRKAVKTNPHVADCLLGRQRLPPILPPYMGFGDETEAAHYLAESLHLWLREPGAIEWVRQTEARRAPGTPRLCAPAPPTVPAGTAWVTRAIRPPVAQTSTGEYPIVLLSRRFCVSRHHRTRSRRWRDRAPLQDLLTVRAPIAIYISSLYTRFYCAALRYGLG